MYKGKKVCGILVETIVEKEIVKKLIIGIGMNVLEESMPKQVENIATSLKIICNEEVDREKIIIETYKRIRKLLRG